MLWPHEQRAGLEGAGNGPEELLRGSQGREKGERGGWEVGKDGGGGEERGVGWRKGKWK